MNRKQTTNALSEMLEQYLDPWHDSRIYWAKEVTFDHATSRKVRVDYMRFKPVNNSVSGIEKGDFYCYEIKSSVEDFNSKNGHNFIGDLNYYIMPEDVYEAVRDKIPFNVGVMVPDAYNMLQTVKKAKRKDRSKPASEMIMMMWRSSRLDVVKTQMAASSEIKDCSGKQAEKHGFDYAYLSTLLAQAYTEGYEDGKAGNPPRESLKYVNIGDFLKLLELL